MQQHSDLETLAKCLIKNNINPAKYPFKGDFMKAPIAFIGIDFDKIFEEHPELGYEPGRENEVFDYFEDDELCEFADMLSKKFGFSWIATWGTDKLWNLTTGAAPEPPECWNIKTSDGKTCMDLFISEDSIDKNEYIKVAIMETNGAEYVKENPEDGYCYVRKSLYDPNIEYSGYESGTDTVIDDIFGPSMDVIPPADGYDGYFLNRKEVDRLINQEHGTYDLYFCTGYCPS